MKHLASFWKPAVLIFGILVAIGIVDFFGSAHLSSPEADFIAATSWDEKEYTDYFTRLAREKGALYAFSILDFVPPTSGVDTHHIGHQIGYVLHEQKGAAGLSECTKDFKYACTHAVITQEFVVEGASALERFTEICSQTSRYSNEYWSCFHGIGHGILAWAGYDYKTAVTMCASVRDAVSADSDIEVWQECVRGATMELLQGNHDKVAWEREQKTFLPDSDILMPCNAPFMERDIRPACYKYLHSRFFGAVGSTKGETDSPSGEKDAKVFAFCASIPEDEPDSLKACYEGIGATFPYYANGNDSRSFKGISDDGLSQIHTRCSHAGNGYQSCMVSAARVILSAGEDRGDVALRFCSLALESGSERQCQEAVAESAWRHLSSTSLATVCNRLPEAIRHECVSGSRGAYTEIE